MYKVGKMMRKDEQESYMTLQRQAIEAEYNNLIPIMRALGQNIPAYSYFVLLWIRLRAEEFRWWYENSDAGRFPLRPDYFVQVWSQDHEHTQQET